MIKAGFITNKKELELGDVLFSDKFKAYLIVTDINLNAITFQLLGDNIKGTDSVVSMNDIKKLKLIYDSNLDLSQIPICDECGLYCFFNYRHYDKNYCGENHLTKNIKYNKYKQDHNEDPKEVYYTEYIFY